MHHSEIWERSPVVIPAEAPWCDLIWSRIVWKMPRNFSKLIEHWLFPLKLVTWTHTQASKIFIAMTDVPFNRPRIHEVAGGSWMSHSAAGETIHYQLIYPQELFVLENSFMVTKPNSETVFALTCNIMARSDISVCYCTSSSDLLWEVSFTSLLVSRPISFSSYPLKVESLLICR